MNGVTYTSFVYSNLQRKDLHRISTEPQLILLILILEYKMKLAELHLPTENCVYVWKAAWFVNIYYAPLVHKQGCNYSNPFCVCALWLPELSTAVAEAALAHREPGLRSEPSRLPSWPLPSCTAVGFCLNGLPIWPGPKKLLQLLTSETDIKCCFWKPEWTD